MQELDENTRKLLIELILNSYEHRQIDQRSIALLFHWVRNKDLPMYDFVKDYFGARYDNICLGMQKKRHYKRRQVNDK